MTVAELRAALAQYPDDMRITVTHYEGGLGDAKLLVTNVRFGPVVTSYAGPHFPSEEPCEGSVPALVLYPADTDDGELADGSYVYR